jgi:hypothetical protein
MSRDIASHLSIERTTRTSRMGEVMPNPLLQPTGRERPAFEPRR